MQLALQGVVWTGKRLDNTRGKAYNLDPMLTLVLALRK